MFFQPLLPTPCSSEDASFLLQSKYSDDQLLRVFGDVLAHVKSIRGCQDFFKPLLTERAAEVALLSKQESLLQKVDIIFSCRRYQISVGKVSAKDTLY